MKIGINCKKRALGFTLVELLIVIGVIAVLASLAFVALNPLARFQDSRNAQRWTDVNAILSALKLQQVDNGGIYLASVDALTPDLYYQIGRGDSCSVTCSNPDITLQPDCVNLEGLMDHGYLEKIPVDPHAANANVDYSHYYMVKHTSGALSVGSCDEEKGSADTAPNIESTR